jgi:FAD binding domain/Berberine and berberine like
MLQPRIISTTDKAIRENALAKFVARMDGRVMFSGQPGYEVGRKNWIGRLDPRCPAMIVYCSTAADVAISVAFARNHDLSIAVRAGGHSLSGDSFCQGGMVVDVSRMKNIGVDGKHRIACADAGLTVGEFDRATQPLWLATVLGECSSVGVAGYTLGGGLGRLMGKHGAGCDKLLSAELINADGTPIRASAEENPDLFWAICGGGGNFGIVTSLEYQLHHVGLTLAGSLTYPLSRVREVLTFLDDYMANIPDELDIVIDIGNPDLMTLSPGVTQPIVNLSLCYCDDPQKGEAAINPLRSFLKPLADTVRVMSYFEAQALANIQPMANFVSTGGMIALETGFIERLGPDLINTVAAFISEPPPYFWICMEHYLHGAVCRPASDHLAFGLRRPGYCSRILSAWRGPNADVSTEWVERLTAALRPFAGGAMYLNYLTASAGEAGVRTAYGSNYDRLAAVKGKYDPTNFFNSNRNIQPAIGRT